MFGKGLVANFIKSLTTQPQLQVTRTSLLPDIAVNEIRNGRLPQLNTDTIFLSKGELCHFIDTATLIKEKNVVTSYEGGSNGLSFRVFRGIYYRIGKNRSRPIRENVQEKTNGIFYITNQRILFVAMSNAFDKEINKITAIIPYSNAIAIQIGSDTYSLLLPQPDIAVSALKLLKP